MRCLWVTRQIPIPADSGELIYSKGLVESLARAGADVTVLCHARGERRRSGDRGPAEGDPRIRVEWVPVASPLRGRPGSLLSHLPSDAYRLAVPLLRRALQEHLDQEKEWDLLVVDHAAMAWALDLFTAYRARRPNALLAYVSHNCEGRLRKAVAEGYGGRFAMKCLLRFDAWKYGRMEARLCREADFITAITPADGDYYRSSLPSKEVVDLLPGYCGDRAAAGTIDASVPRRVVMVGSFEWVAKKHNLRGFLAEAGPLFDGAGIEVQIVGKTDTAFVDEIVRRFPFCRFAANVRSVTPYLLSARFGLIVEELGGGFKLKALEYVFNKLPVAALDGAVEGMPLEAGREILKAPDLPGLVEKVAEKIDDFAWLNQARDHALEKCARLFDWNDRGERLLEAARRARTSE